MISRRVWLGIPLGRRRNRRRLVVGYWFFALVFLSFLGSEPVRAWYSQRFPASLGASVLTGLIFGCLIAFLGGNEGIGPLSSFDGSYSDWRKWSLLEALDRAVCRMRGIKLEAEESVLDERDIRLRNAAHYEAYRVVARIILPLSVAIGIAFATIWSVHKWLALPVFGLAFLAVWNLPQTLILWWEPDVEDVADVSQNGAHAREELRR